jgi:hypothetical protein
MPLCVSQIFMCHKKSRSRYCLRHCYNSILASHGCHFHSTNKTNRYSPLPWGGSKLSYLNGFDFQVHCHPWHYSYFIIFNATFKLQDGIVMDPTCTYINIHTMCYININKFLCQCPSILNLM